jgi:bifunctional DNA-binding transcriptional regulator/antitoxin component of YhaV-PrlF toxin-antitoxin module
MFLRGKFLKMWENSNLCENMTVVTLSSRGRLTLPAEIRSKIKATRFLVVLEEDSIRLIPLPDPLKLRGSVKIPWSVDELEEAGEEFALKRDEG